MARIVSPVTDLKLKPKYSKAEFAQRGEAIYQTRVLPNLNRADWGKIAAVDIESGDFELDMDALRAAQALRARVPDAQIWCVRIGYPAVDRIG